MSDKSQNSFQMLPFKSAMPGVEFPALAHPKVLPVIGVLHQLERNQWVDAASHRQQCFKQLHTLLSIARARVHYHHVSLSEIGFDPKVPLTEEFWSRVPIMTRDILQNERERLVSTDIPKEYQPFTRIRSSGSTGVPIEVLQPAYKRITNAAANILEDIIHGADFSQKNASIRIILNEETGPEGLARADWGIPTSDIFHTGPGAILDARQDPDVQADWLIRQDPAYVQMYPSNLEALLEIFRERGTQLPNLRYIRTMGEHLAPHIREEVREQLGVKIVDAYSSQEVGAIAIQCPEHEHYHLIQDNCFTEILNDNGEVCAPGEIGRVVVTDLMNPAFPLIRYDIGDYAEAGAPCACGRGWPVLNRIMGRVRNLMTYPDGTRKWPLMGWNANKLKEIALIKQYQMIQKTPTSLHINVVGKRRFSNEEVSQLIAKTHVLIGAEFDTTLDQVDEIPRGANGKFEDFKSEVTSEMIAEAKAKAAAKVHAEAKENA